MFEIEGFFDLCCARGLNGEQGVVISKANIKHLMLREDVVDAAASGQFQVLNRLSLATDIVQLSVSLPSNSSNAEICGTACAPMPMRQPALTACDQRR